jgi:hypothetical protein
MYIKPSSLNPAHYLVLFKYFNTDNRIAIHSLTDTCFRKCIPGGNVKNGKLDKYEEPCMRNCVDRFLDANLVVLRELERLRQ